jgi:hypothetical protein
LLIDGSSCTYYYTLVITMLAIFSAWVNYGSAVPRVLRSELWKIYCYRVPFSACLSIEQCLYSERLFRIYNSRLFKCVRLISYIFTLWKRVLGRIVAHFSPN